MRRDFALRVPVTLPRPVPEREALARHQRPSDHLEPPEFDLALLRWDDLDPTQDLLAGGVVASKQRLQAIYADYWSRFQNKNPQEKMERTLLPQDGQ